MNFLGRIGLYPFFVLGLVGKLVLICDVIIMLSYGLARLEARIRRFLLVPQGALVLGLEKFQQLVLLNHCL